MHNKKQFILSIIFVFSSFIACQERRQLKEMNQNTTEMNKTTKDMSENTAQMNKTTAKMADSTTHMDKTTQKMANNTSEMKNTTRQLSKSTNIVIKSVKDTNAKMDQMSEQLGASNAKIDKLVAQTGEANQNMKVMQTKMGETNTKLDTMQAAADEIQLVSSEMLDASRQAISLQMRREALKKLLTPVEGASFDVLLSSRLSEAGKYFMAFEYQLWSDIGEDREPGKRLELAALAAREFMRDVQQFMNSPNQTEPPDADSDQITDQALNSLSAALSEINSKQSHQVKLSNAGTAKDEDKIQALNMYEMIKTALFASKEIRLGLKKIEDYPSYVEEILKFENIALLLMRTRNNFLGALTLAKISNVTDGAATKLMLYYMDWHPDFAKSNLVQLKEIRKYIKGASAAKKILSDLGTSTGEISSMITVYRNLKFDIQEISGRTEQEQSLIKEIMSAIILYMPLPEASLSPAPTAETPKSPAAAAAVH
jgi:uncharacterized phage infection (PIP) family protein YhgE